jgi:hypothetical protein
MAKEEAGALAAIAAAFIGAIGTLGAAIITSQADVDKVERQQPTQFQIEASRQASAFNQSICASTYALLEDEKPNPTLDDASKKEVTHVLVRNLEQCQLTHSGSTASATNNRSNAVAKEASK